MIVSLHHYHPALYFAILALAFVTDHAAQRWAPRRHKNTLYVTIGVIVLGMFVFFKDFAFGMEGPSAAYKNRKWLSGWDMWQAERAKEESDN
jgi:dolichyl-phosphate-mannose-protein mannosyltransferase